MNSLGQSVFPEMAKDLFIAKVLAKDYVYIACTQCPGPMLGSMFCRKGRMATSTRKTVTSVRPMISAAWAFCVSIKSIGKFHFAKNIG